MKIGRLIDPNTYIHGNCARVLSLQTLGQPDDAHAIVLEMIEYALQTQNTSLLHVIKALEVELALRRCRTRETLSWAREYAFDPLKQVVRFFVPQMTQAVEKRPPVADNPLTNREIDIVQLLDRRMSNKEITAELFISPDTVKRHTINIYKKLGARNRQDAVERVKELGLVETS